MIYIKYILFAIVQLLIDVVSFPLAPLVALFADKDGNLPKWLSLFQTYDNTLDGDDGYKAEHRFFPDNANAFQVWANRTGWLWRNPAYGFDMLLGADVQVGDILRINGDRATGDNPFHAGLCTWKLYRQGKLISFQYYFVMSVSTTKCLRINAGWKLWNAEDYEINKVIAQPTTCQLVFTPSINNKG
jgi:hypothetical protein